MSVADFLSRIRGYESIVDEVFDLWFPVFFNVFILILAVEFLDSLLASRMIFQRSCSSSRSLFEGVPVIGNAANVFCPEIRSRVQVSNVFVF